ncbi:hypothetical protein T10_7414 [Trichinella papuae]|uniref:Uncharacterized protein n=1 Tax=Trichinella papuae TaxID=268474 RepID=A0A0V1N224_9BILA|nr:hypothetical protein T10_7414 [Trichinella papuae]
MRRGDAHWSRRILSNYSTKAEQALQTVATVLAGDAGDVSARPNWEPRPGSPSFDELEEQQSHRCRCTFFILTDFRRKMKNK